MTSHIYYIPLLVRADVMGFAAIEILALVMEDKFFLKTLSAQMDTDQDHLDNFPSCR